MLKYIKSLSSYLFLHLVIAMLVCFFAKWLLFEWGALSEMKDWRVFVSSFLWICVFLLIVYLTLKKAGINPKKFFGFCLMNGLIVVFFTIVIWVFTKSYNLNLIEGSYIGIAGSDDIEGDDGEYEIHTSPTFVFKKGDAMIKQQMAVVDEEHDESFEEKFIFWQTAFAAGYDPNYIKQYSNDGSHKIELLITTGILVLFECFVTSLPFAICYMVIPLILFLFKRPFLFKNYSNLKEVIDQQPT